MNDPIALALDHFKHHDPTLWSLATSLPSLSPITPIEPSGYFVHLVEAIISQQLSIKAADTIMTRLTQAIPLIPDEVVNTDLQAFRTVGVSAAKAKAILGLAKVVSQTPHYLSSLAECSDEDTLTALVALPGIGPWTAQMFLMFALGRPDVFSPGDAGVRRAFARHYGDLTLLESQSHLWKPHRTTACRVLWKSLDS